MGLEPLGKRRKESTRRWRPARAERAGASESLGRGESWAHGDTSFKVRRSTLPGSAEDLLPIPLRPNPPGAFRISIPMSRHPHRSSARAQFPMPRHPHPPPIGKTPVASHPHLRFARRRPHDLCPRWRGCLRHDNCSRCLGSSRGPGRRLGCDYCVMGMHAPA